MDKNYRFDTLLIQAGYKPDDTTHSRTPAIYQTTAYEFENAEHAADTFNLKTDSFIYTRLGNPTVNILEERIAAIEGGVGALCTSSGMAAILYAIQNITNSGEEIVACTTLYGGTHTLLTQRLEKLYGIKVRLFNPSELSTLKQALTDKTRLVYIEAIGNPNINIPDFEAIADIAHQHGVPLICDNTFGTPYLVQLKNHGVDIIVHSTTKYISGHGNAMGGVIVDLGTFDWNNGKYPQFTEPDTTYHNLVYTDIGAAAYITKCRTQLLRDTGATMSPFNAYLTLIGLETLSLRVERITRNAEKIATFLKNHQAVNWINYPFLEGDRYHDLYKKYFKNGVGGIFTFGIKGGVEAGRKLIDTLEIFSLVANIADVRSMVIHPASTTHAQLSDDELIDAGVAPDMVRLSVGIEDVNDLIADLAQALEVSQQ